MMCNLLESSTFCNVLCKKISNVEASLYVYVDYYRLDGLNRK